MKNRYEIRGDVTVIYLSRIKGDEIESIISTHRLDKVKQVDGWNAVLKDNGEYYVRGYYNKQHSDEESEVYLHRFIVDAEEGDVVDHLNHNPLDNTDENLYFATGGENQQNRKGASRNNKKSRLRGVYQTTRGDKWFAATKINGVCYYLGTFNTKEAANIIVSEFRARHAHSTNDKIVYPELDDVLGDLNNIGTKRKQYSKYKGISWDNKKQKWYAYVYIPETGLRKFISYCNDEVGAALVRDYHAREYGINDLNFPNETPTEREIEIRKYHRNKSSKYVGVHWNTVKNKWQATITVDYKNKNLGCFDKEYDAGLEHDKAAIIFHGENARLNFKNVTVTQDDIDRITRTRKQTSRYDGVCFNKSKKKWEAYSNIEGKQTYFGCYHDDRVASIARDIALFKHYGPTLPAGKKFNHPDLFGEHTITWERVTSDPTLSHLYHTS